MSNTPANPVANPQKILVIEDEKALADVLGYNLRREGYEVTLAHDGQEGLKASQAKAHDLVILDLMIPGNGGMKTLAELNQLPAPPRSSPKTERPSGSAACARGTPWRSGTAMAAKTRFGRWAATA